MTRVIAGTVHSLSRVCTITGALAGSERAGAFGTHARSMQRHEGPLSAQLQDASCLAAAVHQRGERKCQDTLWHYAAVSVFCQQERRKSSRELRSALCRAPAASGA